MLINNLFFKLIINRILEFDTLYSHQIQNHPIESFLSGVRLSHTICARRSFSKERKRHVLSRFGKKMVSFLTTQSNDLE